MTEPRLLFLVTEDWYFWSHRRTLAEAARNSGFEILLATRVQDLGDSIRNAGMKLIPIRLRRGSRNPLKEFFSLGQLVSIYRREKPTIVHHVGVKPILYGSWAARLAGVPCVVNAQPGLGYVFTARSYRAALLRKCVQTAYRSAWGGRNSKVVFQNQENLDFFVDRGVVTRDRTALIRGCGVNLEEFRYRPEPDGVPVVMMAGRVLWNKGVGEMVAAARLLREQNVECRMVLVGRPDPDNPESVPETVLRQWHDERTIEWWGYRSDMADALSEATLVVQPSYEQEGLPKSLVEAAAVGRAIVATDVPGCREVVHDNENGLLVPPRDAAALAKAIARLLTQPSRRAEMGRQGRQLAEQEFSSDTISRQTIAMYQEMMAAARH